MGKIDTDTRHYFMNTEVAARVFDSLIMYEY